MQKPDYKNWVPKSMVIGLGAATAASASLFVLFGASDRILKGRARKVAAAAFGTDAAVFDNPGTGQFGTVEIVPAVEGLAVEEKGPAFGFFFGGEAVIATLAAACKSCGRSQGRAG